MTLKRVRLIEDDLKKGSDGLNNKQRRFAEEFCVDYNMTAAAKRAGYSKKTSYSMGSELLKKPQIAAYIKKQQAALSRRTEISQDRVLQELASIGFGPSEPVLPRPSDRIVALLNIGRHIGMFSNKVEVSGHVGLLSVNVTASDLESAKQLVDGFRSEQPKLIEGSVEDAGK